jgi:hypothetical protein
VVCGVWCVVCGVWCVVCGVVLPLQHGPKMNFKVLEQCAIVRLCALRDRVREREDGGEEGQ